VNEEIVCTMDSGSGAQQWPKQPLAQSQQLAVLLEIYKTQLEENNVGRDMIFELASCLAETMAHNRRLVEGNDHLRNIVREMTMNDGISSSTNVNSTSGVEMSEDIQASVRTYLVEVLSILHAVPKEDSTSFVLDLIQRLLEATVQYDVDGAPKGSGQDVARSSLTTPIFHDIASSLPSDSAGKFVDIEGFGCIPSHLLQSMHALICGQPLVGSQNAEVMSVLLSLNKCPQETINRFMGQVLASDIAPSASAGEPGLHLRQR